VKNLHAFEAPFIEFCARVRGGNIPWPSKVLSLFSVYKKSKLVSYGGV